MILTGQVRVALRVRMPVADEVEALQKVCANLGDTASMVQLQPRSTSSIVCVWWRSQDDSHFPVSCPNSRGEKQPSTFFRPPSPLALISKSCQGLVGESHLERILAA